MLVIQALPTKVQDSTGETISWRRIEGRRDNPCARHKTLKRRTGWKLVVLLTRVQIIVGPIRQRFHHLKHLIL